MNYLYNNTIYKRVESLVESVFWLLIARFLQLIIQTSPPNRITVVNIYARLSGQFINFHKINKNVVGAKEITGGNNRAVQQAAAGTEELGREAL